MSAPTVEILSCFDNIIALRGGCEDETSTSGLYSNDIDITYDFLNAIVTRQFSGAKDLHERKLAFSIKQVVSEVIGALTPNFHVGTLLQNQRIGFYQDDLKLIAGDGNLKGINIDLWNCQSYLNLFLSEISLQINQTQDVDVLVYDLIQNKLLDTITISCTANEISKAYPQKTYKSDRSKLNLFIGYDSTGLSSNTTYIKERLGCSNCGGGSNLISKNPYEWVGGVKIDSAAQKIKSNLTHIGETGGLSVVHSLSCNHESWLCSYSNLMSMAILYRYGINILDFAANVSPNDRINTTVQINSEEIKNRLANLTQWYKDELKSVLGNIKTPTDKECFVCRTPARHVISL